MILYRLCTISSYLKSTRGGSNVCSLRFGVKASLQAVSTPLPICVPRATSAFPHPLLFFLGSRLSLFSRRPFLPSHPILYLLSVLSTLALPHRFLVSRSSLIPLAVCAACCRIVLKVTDGAIRLNQQSPNQLIGFLVSRLSVLGCLVLLRFESMEGWSRDLILQFRTTDTRKLNSCFLAGTTSLGRLTPSVLTLHL